MKLVVALEHHFLRCGEDVFTSLAFGYSFWEEYLAVFDEVCVVARVKEIDSPPQNTFLASGKQVTFYDLPDYLGVWDFAKKIISLLWKTSRTHRLGNCFVLFSGNIGVLVWINLILRRRGKYFFRCVGNVKLGIATEDRSFLYKYIAHLYHFFTKKQAGNAIASSYTSEYLRRIYPNGFRKEYVFSNVELTSTVFAQPRQVSCFQKTPFRFVSVGRVEKQKGHKWLLESVECLNRNCPRSPWKLSIVGPGSQIPSLQNYVNENRLQHRVEFCGSVKWGKELFELLDESHVFVLPSLTEGMSRALLEGMARGLPAIASNTGGNPEIVCGENLVDIWDVNGLCEKMNWCLSHPEELAEQSLRNWKVAQSFQQNTNKVAFLRYMYENSADS